MGLADVTEPFRAKRRQVASDCCDCRTPVVFPNHRASASHVLRYGVDIGNQQAVTNGTPRCLFPVMGQNNSLLKRAGGESGWASSIIRQNEQPDWATEALNAPTGKLAQAILNDPNAKEKSETGFSREWLERVRRKTLSLTGDARRHALVMFSHSITWFYHNNERWTEEHLLSALADHTDDSQAFWAGFFWAARPPQPKLFLEMKPALLEMSLRGSATRRQHTEILSAILLMGWSHERIVTDHEMRSVLIATDDDFRSQVVWHLKNWSKEDGGTWKRDALIFFEVWPRQRVVKTSSVLARLAELAFSSNDQFPICGLHFTLGSAD